MAPLASAQIISHVTLELGGRAGKVCYGISALFTPHPWVTDKTGVQKDLWPWIKRPELFGLCSAFSWGCCSRLLYQASFPPTVSWSWSCVLQFPWFVWSHRRISFRVSCVFLFLTLCMVHVSLSWHQLSCFFLTEHEEKDSTPTSAVLVVIY